MYLVQCSQFDLSVASKYVPRKPRFPLAWNNWYIDSSHEAGTSFRSAVKANIFFSRFGNRDLTRRSTNSGIGASFQLIILSSFLSVRSRNPASNPDADNRSLK